MKTIIVLTGSFNPVTVAHYRILSDAVEKFGADEGVFVATNDKYLAKKLLLKKKTPSNFILPETMRSVMLQSLSKENPKLSYWGTELGGADPDTYKTLLKLVKDKQKQYPNEEIRLYYLFGADKLKNISRWHNKEEMINLFEYLVYTRQFDIDTVINKDSFLQKHRDRIHVMRVDDEDIEDVSSTEVRRCFFAGEDYSKFMNKGPCEILKTLSPTSFAPITDEELIKANILYGGRFGKNAARKLVFQTNNKVFKTWPYYLGSRDEHLVAKVYDREFTVEKPTLSVSTQTDCVNADCVDVAKTLLDEGLNPAILNLASRISPGGGYHQGTRAQEESLCYMSTLSQSLYQFGNPKRKHIRESSVMTVPNVYPLDVNFGGIYSPCVTFFRHNEDKHYSLRESTFDCPVVSVASLSNREQNEYTNDERKYFDVAGYLTDEGKEIELNKIRTLFRIALDNGHDSMVLGAFGCGVYNLHSEEVATLFHDVLKEPEFENRFKKLVFAIYEGKPSPRKGPIGREGKFAAFYEKFGTI